jgi:hypothetical protein
MNAGFRSTKGKNHGRHGPPSAAEPQPNGERRGLLMSCGVVRSLRCSGSPAMQSVLARQGSVVKTTLSGFDRVRFRGTLRWLANVKRMATWLHRANALLKDFRGYALELTDTIRQATQQLAETENRPVEYRAGARRQRVCASAQTLDRCAHLCLAGPLSTTERGLRTESTE